MPTVSDIASVLEDWAPPSSAFDYDNVGLLVGDAASEVTTVLVALDLTPDVIREAVEIEAQLIVTHHPLFFHPPKRLLADDYIGGMSLDLARRGIACYAIHTNLDVAFGGVSMALAVHLGLESVRFLAPLDDALRKLVVFVPEAHAEAVRQAAADAGAGRIGEYEACSFETSGTGRFRPGEASHPHVGRAAGELEEVYEVRLEVEVMRWDLGRVLARVRDVHPYEEVAYDVIAMDKPASRLGGGAIGTLPEPTTLEQFLGRVATRLHAPSLRYSGEPGMAIRTVAVCGGAGSSLLGKALSEGADAFVTADVTYHHFFDALDADGRHRAAIIDPGHYESEAHTERLLVDHLAPRFAGVEFLQTAVRTSPMRTALFG